MYKKRKGWTPCEQEAIFDNLSILNHRMIYELERAPSSA
jgi:hypothetical protein